MLVALELRVTWTSFMSNRALVHLIGLTTTSIQENLHWGLSELRWRKAQGVRPPEAC